MQSKYSVNLKDLLEKTKKLIEKAKKVYTKVKSFQSKKAFKTLFGKYRVKIVLTTLFVAVGVLIFLPKPSSPVVTLEVWWTETWFLTVAGIISAILLVWLVVTFYKKLLTKKPEKEAEKPVGARAATQPVVAVVYKKNSNVFWITVLLAGILALVWFYVLPSHPEVVSPKTLESLKNQYPFKLLAPYALAPLMGLMSYFLSNKGYKRFFYALMITIATAVVIALWTHTEVLKTSIAWFKAGPGTAASVLGLDFSECLGITLLLLALFSGKIIDALVGILFMIILCALF